MPTLKILQFSQSKGPKDLSLFIFEDIGLVIHVVVIKTTDDLIQDGKMIRDGISIQPCQRFAVNPDCSGNKTHTNVY